MFITVDGASESVIMGVGHIVNLLQPIDEELDRGPPIGFAILLLGNVGVGLQNVIDLSSRSFCVCEDRVGVINW